MRVKINEEGYPVLILNDNIPPLIVSNITVEEVKKRLVQLGIKDQEQDNDKINFYIEKVISYVLNFCNREDVPGIIEPIVLDKICSDFMIEQKNMGNISDFDYDSGIKTIKEGDTSITYGSENGSSTTETRFNDTMNYLQDNFNLWLLPHRRLRWW